MSIPTLDDGRVILAVVQDKNENSCLVAKYLANGQSTPNDFVKEISGDYKFVTNALVVSTKQCNDEQKALQLNFVFDSLQIIDSEGNVGALGSAPTIKQLRELIHELSVQFSGKTFTEQDFDNVVHQQVLNSPDDNRNQNEVYDDACNVILFFFTYGLIEEVFENTPPGSVILVYNSTESASMLNKHKLQR